MFTSLSKLVFVYHMLNVLSISPLCGGGSELVPETEFYVPNDYVLRAARQHDELLAGASIHPNRRDALEELDRCLELGAV